jgi:hypothetical protein
MSIQSKLTKIEENLFSDVKNMDDLVTAREVFRALLRRGHPADKVKESLSAEFTEIPPQLFTVKATGALKQAEDRRLAAMRRCTLTDEEIIRLTYPRLIDRGHSRRKVLEYLSGRFPRIEPSVIKRLANPSEN